MIKKTISPACIILFLLYPLLTQSKVQQSAKIIEYTEALSDFLEIGTLEVNEVDNDKLPEPYSFLLVQPLMTLGIEQYYHRTTHIKVIRTARNYNKKSYSRAIYMYLESNPSNHQGTFKHDEYDGAIVELAYITINFKELPAPVITSVLKTDTPFGKILVNNKIRTFSVNKAYFSIQCTHALKKILHCKINKKTYGRINTLIREDNKKWVAQVIEVLSGI